MWLHRDRRVWAARQPEFSEGERKLTRGVSRWSRLSRASGRAKTLESGISQGHEGSTQIQYGC
jgi:hypothetical protein